MKTLRGAMYVVRLEIWGKAINKAVGARSLMQPGEPWLVFRSLSTYHSLITTPTTRQQTHTDPDGKLDPPDT